MTEGILLTHDQVRDAAEDSYKWYLEHQDDGRPEEVIEAEFICRAQVAKVVEWIDAMLAEWEAQEGIRHFEPTGELGRIQIARRRVQEALRAAGGE